MTDLIKGNWDEDAVAALRAVVGSQTSVSYTQATEIAETMNRSVRSVTGKLRSMDITVGAKPANTPTFSEEETDALANFLEENSGSYTFAEVAENFADGGFTRPQVQGKILSMEMTDHVRPTEQVEHQSAYSDEDVATIVSTVEGGGSLEDVVSALDGRFTQNSVRGKCLSLLRAEAVTSVPKQANKVERESTDYFDGVDGEMNELTVDEIAEQLEKTPRGVKVALTRRGIACKDYTPKAKAA